MFYGKRYRFHHALTERGPVAGVDINVLAPETFWTVVGVAVSFDGRPTMLAGEIFNAAFESFVHRIYYLPFSLVRRSNVRFRLGEAVAACSKFQ